MRFNDASMAGFRALAERHDLALLALFGSQARGRGRPGSDVDLAFRRREATGPIDIERLFADLAAVIGHGRLDLVDLRNSPPVLACEATVGGRALYEDRPGRFAEERMRSIQRRMDTAPLRAAQRRFMERWLQGRLA